VGDLVRGEVSGKNESNKITILDVSQILDHYTQLDTPVTDDNREYDLDFNDVIDIFDISIVISN